jgi:hypothetical protein
MNASTTRDTWTELADRETDGLEVRLLWSETTGRVLVAVDDTRVGHRFAFDVPRGEALAAFHPPFAYAPARATRRYRAAEPSTDLQLQR